MTTEAEKAGQRMSIAIRRSTAYYIIKRFYMAHLSLDQFREDLDLLDPEAEPGVSGTVLVDDELEAVG